MSTSTRTTTRMTLREYIDQLGAIMRLAGDEMPVMVEDPFRPGMFQNIEYPVVMSNPDTGDELLLVK